MKQQRFIHILLAALAVAHSSAATPPANLSSEDWSSIRAAYERHRYSAAPVEGGLRARNLTQRWTIHYDSRGFLIAPDHSDWTWGLELASYVADGRVTTISGPARAANKNGRVAYAWHDGLEEWFINDSRGLEHGFTLQEAPTDGAARIELNLRVRGGLRPEVEGKGRFARFVDARGAAIVSYAGLKAWDAEARDLDARMETTEEGLRIVLDHGCPVISRTESVG